MPDTSSALTERLNAFSLKAEKVYESEQMESRLNLLSNFYHDRETLTRDPNPMAIHVNKVYPRVRIAMSSMYAKRPEIIAKPRRAEDTDSAKSAELLLNYLTRHLRLSRELRECLFWSRLGMYGVVKLGIETVKGATLPIFRAMDPRAVRFDTSSDRFRPEEGRWQKFRYRRSLRQLMESGLYEEAKLTPLLDRVLKGRDARQEDTTDVWLWEHYLVEGKKIIVATEAAGMEAGRSEDRVMRPWSVAEQVWIREEEFTPLAGLPGRVLVFVPSPRTWYPASPVEMWLEQQKEINAFRTQKLIAAERSNAKILYDVTKIGDPEKEKLEDPNPQMHVGVTGNPKEFMSPVPYGTVSPDIYRGEIEAEQSIQEIDGTGGAQLGVEAPRTGSTSATRDALVENSMRLRQSDSQEIWEEFLEDLYQGLLNLAQGHMKGDLYLALSGEEERRMSRETIQGDLDVLLSFGSTLPTDREREWARAKDIYQLTAQDPNISQVWRLRQLLMAEGDVKNIEQAIQVQPMPPGPFGPPGMPPPPGAPPQPNGAHPSIPMPGSPQASQATRALVSPPNRTALSLAAMFRAGR